MIFRAACVKDNPPKMSQEKFKAVVEQFEAPVFRCRKKFVFFLAGTKRAAIYYESAVKIYKYRWLRSDI